MVVVLCTRGTGIGMMVPNGLAASCDYAYPIVGRECGKGRVNGYQFIRPHDGAGLFCPRKIYVDSSASGNVHHRCPHARVAGNVKAVGIDPLFREEFRRPGIGCRGLADEGEAHSS